MACHNSADALNVFFECSTGDGGHLKKKYYPALQTVQAESGPGVDDFPRPVLALASTGVKEFWERGRHHHRKAQLLYTVRGIIHCDVDRGVWIVPPQCAIWIPGGLPHAAHGSGPTECYCLFMEPDVSPLLPEKCCTLSVSPLLRELIYKAAVFTEVYPVQGPEARLLATLVDELAAAPVEDLHIPMPIDQRLRRLANRFLADPAEKGSLGDWASSVGMSERTMGRLFNVEIGMSFGRWRRQLHVILAIQQLSKGKSVQAVAYDLGYDSPSSFITMFRRVLGKPPARYLADRFDKASSGDFQPVPTLSLTEDD